VQLTKFSHSCVRLDDGDRSLVIDPGVFSEVDEALDGTGAVLVTHEHADHLDTDKVLAAARRNSRLRIWAPAGVAASLGELGEQVVAVGPGEEFDADGIAVRTFGGQHALIHPTIPVVANVGYLIGGICHPGDSLVVPPVPVDVLLLPVNAPWSKLAEVIDYAIAVRAPRVHQIHDGLLNQNGFGVIERQVTAIAGAHGPQYQHLEPRSTVSV
jgi:L-ascorbate metabolism protein UlaG (beta-lactamase superfamily)